MKPQKFIARQPSGLWCEFDRKPEWRKGEGKILPHMFQWYWVVYGKLPKQIDAPLSVGEFLPEDSLHQWNGKEWEKVK